MSNKSDEEPTQLQSNSSEYNYRYTKSNNPSGLEFVHITKTAGSTIESTAAKSGIKWGACHYKRIKNFAKACSSPDIHIGGAMFEPWHTPHYWFLHNPYEGNTKVRGTENVLRILHARDNGGGQFKPRCIRLERRRLYPHNEAELREQLDDAEDYIEEEALEDAPPSLQGWAEQPPPQRERGGISAPAVTSGPGRTGPPDFVWPASRTAMPGRRSQHVRGTPHLAQLMR